MDTCSIVDFSPIFKSSVHTVCDGTLIPSCKHACKFVYIHTSCILTVSAYFLTCTSLIITFERTIITFLCNNSETAHIIRVTIILLLDPHATKFIPHKHFSQHISLIIITIILKLDQESAVSSPPLLTLIVTGVYC